SLSALAQRLGVSAVDAASVVGALEEETASVVGAPAATPAAPLLPMTGRNGASSAPKTLLNRKRVIAVRKEITPSKMSCSCCLSNNFSFFRLINFGIVSWPNLLGEQFLL